MLSTAAPARLQPSRAARTELLKLIETSKVAKAAVIVVSESLVRVITPGRQREWLSFEFATLITWEKSDGRKEI